MGKLGKLKIEYYRERKKNKKTENNFPNFPKQAPRRTPNEHKTACRSAEIIFIQRIMAHFWRIKDALLAYKRRTSGA